MNTIDDYFGEVIYAYTRAQALEDGILIDVSDVAVGVDHRVCVTCELHCTLVATDEEFALGEDFSSRLKDVISLIPEGRKNENRTFEATIMEMVEGELSPCKLNLMAHFGPADTPELEWTIGFPSDF